MNGVVGFATGDSGRSERREHVSGASRWLTQVEDQHVATGCSDNHQRIGDVHGYRHHERCGIIISVVHASQAVILEYDSL